MMANAMGLGTKQTVAPTYPAEFVTQRPKQQPYERS